MDILSKIVNYKTQEVNERKSLYPLKLLEKSVFFNTKCVSLKEYLLNSEKTGIIAEFKKKSPSKPDINNYADIQKVTIGYMQAGASALSILTDNKFFGGSLKNLSEARDYNYCPILQKDFIIDEYQIYEAKSYGADSILLIASILSKTQITKFTKTAKQLGLEVLFEIHFEHELSKFDNSIEIIGVNNRQLSSFETNINNSLRIAKYLPENITKISESGINTVQQLTELIYAGFDGFLMGTKFMSEINPADAFKIFVNNLKNYTKNQTNSVDKHLTSFKL